MKALLAAVAGAGDPGKPVSPPLKPAEQVLVPQLPVVVTTPAPGFGAGRSSSASTRV